MKVLENKFINIDNNEYEIIKKVLDSHQLSGMAEIVKEYEIKLASFFGSKHALAVTNGTTAIEIALRASGVQAGDEVITTPLGPVMTPLPILAIGATPVFVDCESENSFNISLEDIDQKVTTKTKAVISVPMWGYPNNMELIKDFCVKRNIILIEDVSHCHGTNIDNKFQGTFGDIGVFSTQERKLICTGEGGFVLTDNDYLAARIKELRNFGKPMREELLQQGFADQYGILFGLNYRINAFSAGIGITQIDKLKTKISKRTENAMFLTERISKSVFSELPIIKNGKSNYYALVLKVSHPSLTSHQINEKLNSYGIVSDTYRFKYRPLYEMPLFTEYKSTCKNATILSTSIITLPTHEGLTEADLNFIVKTINEITNLKC